MNDFLFLLFLKKKKKRKGREREKKKSFRKKSFIRSSREAHLGLTPWFTTTFPQKNRSQIVHSLGEIVHRLPKSFIATSGLTDCLAFTPY
jgi:hypothetical protein